MFSRSILLAIGFAAIAQGAPLRSGARNAVALAGPVADLSVEVAAGLQPLPRALSNPNKLVLAGRASTYTVVNGDIGWDIAATYNIPFSELDAANPGVVWTNLQIGQVLNLPSDASLSSSSSSSSSAAAVEYTTSTTTTFATSSEYVTATFTTYSASSSSAAAASTSAYVAPSSSAAAASSSVYVVSSSSAAAESSSTYLASSSSASSTTSASASTYAPQASGEPTITSDAKVDNSVAVSSINDQDGKSSGSDAYTMYSGDGSSGAGWPAQSDWVSFDVMWNSMEKYIGQTCGAGVEVNTAEETAQLRLAIEAVALASEVDHRFILATMMQESTGCVRVNTTNYGVNNPGIMQSHDGTGSCNDNVNQQSPCPESQIFQMVQDGVMGTAAGDGSAQVVNQAVQKGGSGAQAFYMAARMYNSGSIDASGDLGKGIATHCYSSDIANRLTGWVTATCTCTLD